MAKVRVFNHSIPEIGYISRTVTQGDEFEMVSRYINYLITVYKRSKCKNAAIFIEPQIDSGYPDIVIVEYTSKLGANWNDFRWDLTNTDLKILYQIQMQKYVSVDELSDLLGFTHTSIEKSINHLCQCDLVHLSSSKKSVRNVPLSRYCQIRKVISIEAKINKWADAIKQAERNIWFSTESYILMNRESCNSSILNDCQKRGIGIILVNGSIKKALESEQRLFPVSYASLQFGEWLQKAEKMEVAVK